MNKEIYTFKLSDLSNLLKIVAKKENTKSMKTYPIKTYKKIAAVINAPLEAGDSIPSIAKTKVSLKIVIKDFHLIKKKCKITFHIIFTYIL